ncbi:MAG: type II toxin-antitoxin system RelE/ParE family toxin [Magnetococcales bacterium]|nr:type II toxin-antitoxin system RelE/ParE family toxin [Magnetococcales bacterium]
MKMIAYSKQATRTLSRLSLDDSRRIRAAIQSYANVGQGDVKKLCGLPFFRLRIGNWRVIFDDDGLIMSIEKIGSRGDIYKGV